MASASRVETLLTCAKTQERRAMLSDGFSVGYFWLGMRLHLHEHIGGEWRSGGGGQCFLMMKDGEDSAAGLSQCMYLAESSAETSVERSWTACAVGDFDFP